MVLAMDRSRVRDKRGLRTGPRADDAASDGRRRALSPLVLRRHDADRPAGRTAPASTSSRWRTYTYSHRLSTPSGPPWSSSGRRVEIWRPCCKWIVRCMSWERSSSGSWFPWSTPGWQAGWHCGGRTWSAAHAPAPGLHPVCHLPGQHAALRFSSSVLLLSLVAHQESVANSDFAFQCCGSGPLLHEVHFPVAGDSAPGGLSMACRGPRRSCWPTFWWPG